MNKQNLNVTLQIIHAFVGQDFTFILTLLNFKPAPSHVLEVGRYTCYVVEHRAIWGLTRERVNDGALSLVLKV